MERLISLPGPGTARVVAFTTEQGDGQHLAVRALSGPRTDIWTDDQGSTYTWVELLTQREPLEVIWP